MQIYLTDESMNKSLNQYIDVFFNGDEFRVFFGGGLVYGCKATKGDCFELQTNGKYRPTIKKKPMPESRGGRILWALSFVEDTKRALSFEEFQFLFNDKLERYGSDSVQVYMKANTYGIAFAEKHNKNGKSSKEAYKMKPIYGWISDDISDDDLNELISNYQKCRKIYCPIDYLYCL